MLTALMYDSAAGSWPIAGDGAGTIILAYTDTWGGTYNGVPCSAGPMEGIVR